MKYFKTNNIKVFPSDIREPEEDWSSNNITEQCIVSLVNRFTHNQSFIISGFSITQVGNNIVVGQGKCNIGGYFIDVLNNITLENNNSNKIYLALNITKNTLDNISSIQVQGTDVWLEWDETLNNTINNTEYTGIEIIQTNNLRTKASQMYLLIGEKQNNTWITPISSLVIDNNLFAFDDGEI